MNPSKYLGNEKKYIEAVLDGESWSATTGSWTTALERKFAETYKTNHAIAFNSGTSTLHAILEALDIPRNHVILVPALGPVMTAFAVKHAGLIPIFVDVDPDTYNMSPRDLEEKIKLYNPHAIIVVHLYGKTCDMAQIMLIAGNIPVIEDCAQAVLSYGDDGKLAGTYGVAASFSFESSKHLSCGEGGMVITNDTYLAQRIRKIGGLGFKNLTADSGTVRANPEVFQDPDYIRHSELGFNYRLSEFQAAIALAQLERAEELVNLRRQSARIFIEVLKVSGLFEVAPYDPNHSYYTLAVEYLGAAWKEFRRKYVEAGGDGIYSAWAVPYKEPPLQFGRKAFCINAEYVQKRIMQFKTNYRDLDLASEKAAILAKVLRG